MEAKVLKCTICRNQDNNQIFKIREMMFGTKAEFAYFECGNCGCLQIAEFPNDMTLYYPKEFYVSSQISAQKKTARDLALKLLLKTSFLRNDETTLKLSSFLFPHSSLLKSLRKTQAKFDAKILEVGCGKGTLMLALKKWGFKKIAGVDPYSCEKIAEDLEIFKTSIHEIKGEEPQDLIIFDHSFEHIPDQFATLAKVSAILAQSGTCMIRMPVKTDYIWNKYGIDWVQIDAPRHFFLHTLKSIDLLADEAGLQIDDVVFNSTEFQFWGSEQYKKNIPLRAKNSFAVNPEKSIFAAEEIAGFREKANDLNAKSQGDQAEFFLKKK